MIITDNKTLFSRIDDLGRDDAVVGRVRIRPGEEGLLLLLASRGVRMMPSALSQLLSRSKVMQAAVFASFMPPLTRPVFTRHDLFQVIAEYGENRVGRVVTKLDRGNGGLGVHLWRDIEEVHNQVCFGTLAFPFVVQPFIDDCRDLRLIVLGSYHESYWRENSSGFRNNLHAGGVSRPVDTDPQWLDFGKRVMAAGEFPYAHIDLMVADGKFYLGEINLRGGLRGAAIGAPQYLKLREEIHTAFVSSLDP